LAKKKKKKAASEADVLDDIDEIDEIEEVGEPAGSPYEAVLACLKQLSFSETDALVELARLGQLAAMEFLSDFVTEQKLTADWETLLLKLMPQYSEAADREVLAQAWANVMAVTEIIRKQGSSAALYERFYSIAFPEDEVHEGEKVAHFTQAAPGRGLDVGTVHIVGSYLGREDQKVHYNVQRNAFLDMESDDFTKDMLRKLKLKLVNIGDKDCVIGDGAFKLANIFQTTTRRPMSGGMISANEGKALTIIERIISDTIGPGKDNEPCVFTIPADPIDSDRNNLYHTGALELILKRLGYKPMKIDEGHAVVFAELENQDFTGIGISCGGGMSNICVCYRSMPALSFSISRGGDWIDQNVADSLDMPISRVAAVKEEGFDLRRPHGRIQEALAIYYSELIKYTLEQIGEQMRSKESMPIFADPVDIVVCGGTAMVGGFADAFRQELFSIEWPIEIAEVRLAEDPLQTVSKGCLIATMGQ
jgi:hypothetical protein